MFVPYGEHVKPPTCLCAHRIKIIAKPSEVAKGDEVQRDRDGPNVNPVEGWNGKSEGEVQGDSLAIIPPERAEARVFLDVEPFFVVRGFPLQHAYEQPCAEVGLPGDTLS